MTLQPQLNSRHPSRTSAVVATLAITVVIALVFGTISWVNHSGTMPQKSAGLSYLGSSWYSNLTTIERNFCLKPYGTNWSIPLNSTTHLLITNLTNGTVGLGPSCGSTPKHNGTVVQIVHSHVVRVVVFGSENNTTTLSNLSAGEADYVLTTVEMFGGTGLAIQFGEKISFHNATSDRFSPLRCWSDCGGGDTSGSTNQPGTGWGSSGCPIGNVNPTVYIWDNVCFDKNPPVAYPHPDRTFYGLLAAGEWDVAGTSLTHYQLGTNLVNFLNNIGPIGVGAVIGATLGALWGGWVGAAVGTAAGVIIGAILVYVVGTVWVDESGAIWYWVNSGFLVYSVPIILWLGGSAAAAAYMMFSCSYLRVGNSNYINSHSISGP
jgi:hypothetical protein